MAEKQFTDEELWSSMLDHDLDVTIAPKNSEPAMLIKGKALAEYKNLKSQLAESQAEVEHLQKMLKEHQEALGDATKIYSEKKEAQLAERDKEIERLIQEIKDYMKPNPLACGEMLQCNACQGTCECDCEIRKERSK